MKTFLSIGAGPGMGLETAERFARAGAVVTVASRSQQKLAAALPQIGGEAGAVVLDAQDAA